MIFRDLSNEDGEVVFLFIKIELESMYTSFSH